ncbi:hypothetical protein Rleg5DRAFT_2853 [Rhizobium leguminosarum bv. viciae WSM1455]|nr:hypothetical protein Rleg5DRAFT_2853 [Rhizobium leguminosarum bv. viciae WSM1455]
MIIAPTIEDADLRMGATLHCAIANGYAFITMKKYGRTYHLPISPGATSDDKVMTKLDGLMIADLVITEKMDGENTTIHQGGSLLEAEMPVRMGKYVRGNHIQSETHWMQSELIPNRLANF